MGKNPPCCSNSGRRMEINFTRKRGLGEVSFPNPLFTCYFTYIYSGAYFEWGKTLI